MRKKFIAFNIIIILFALTQIASAMPPKPIISVDDYNPSAGSPLKVSFTCNPNTG